MFFVGAPTIENKIEFKIQNTKVVSAKVPFDTVRLRFKERPDRAPEETLVRDSPGTTTTILFQKVLRLMLHQNGA